MKRILVILGALAVAVAALVGTGAYRPGDGSAAAPTSSAPTTAPAQAATGALVLGGQAGELAVGLAADRTGDGLDLEVTVLGQDGAGVADLQVSFGVHGARSAETVGEPCGAGCYRASVDVAPPAHVSLLLEGRAGLYGSVEFPLPAEWRPAGDVVRRATEAYRDLQSVAYDERLESRPGNAIETRWEVEAPDRLSYRIAAGAQGIVIGDRRWDRAQGADWVASSADPLVLPAPPWAGTVRSASVLGSARVDGRPVWVVSFVSDLGLPVGSDLDLPTWFTVRVDKETYRPLELRMTTAAHFMTQHYLSFDEPLPIEPPK